MKKNVSLILVWVSLTSTAPFIFYSWPGHPYKLLTFSCLLIMSAILVIKRNLVVNKGISFSSLILVLFFMIENLRADSNEGITYLIQIVAFFISYLFIQNIVGYKSFMKSYLVIIILMGIGGTLTFFVHYLWGLNPIFSVDYSESGTSYFMGLTSTNAMYVGDQGFIRYSGFFDEPGAYALYASFALILNKLYLDNKKVEIILSILPLFTLSIAFFIFVILYQIFFNLNKNTILLFFLFIFSLSLILIYLKSDSETMLYAQTIGRFEIDDSQGFKGNNRAIQQAADKNIFSENILFGKGLSIKSGANLYAVLAKHGIIGSFFYYVFLVFFIIKLFKTKREKLFCFKILILISLSFFHRPELTSAFGLIVITTMILSISNRPDKIIKSTNK